MNQQKRFMEMEVSSSNPTCCSAPKFEDLAPASEDTAEKIQELLTLPEEARTFKFPSVIQESSSGPQVSTGSKATRSSSRFALADIEKVISKGSAVKKEKPLLILPKPIKLSPLLSKKRKTSESWELSLEALEPVEILKRIGSFTQEASNIVLRSYDSVKARAEKAEGDLKEQTRIFQEHLSGAGEDLEGEA